MASPITLAEPPDHPGLEALDSPPPPFPRRYPSLPPRASVFESTGEAHASSTCRPPQIRNGAYRALGIDSGRQTCELTQDVVSRSAFRI